MPEFLQLFMIKFSKEVETMTTIHLKIPDEVARLINSLSQREDEFILKAIEEKIIREKGKVKLEERNISESEAVKQRTAFAAFAEDWDSPEMDAYDKL